MRVTAKSALKEHFEKRGREDSKQPLLAWHAEAIKAHWESPQDIKEQYKNASIINQNRVVFNIKGNAYRLVVHINYRSQAIYIRFIGTHKEYDKIDVATI